MRARWWIVGVLSVVLGCGAEVEAPVPAFRNVGADVAFVGDAACASCHEEAYQGYQAHGMAHSLYALTPETRAEPLLQVPLHDPASGYAYAVGEDGDGLFQEETLRDSAGVVIHRLRRRMDYVVGSGTAARTYFAEQAGRLFQLPLTWFTQSQTWAFSPGYELRNARFDRLVPDRCMACHAAVPEAIPFVEGTYASAPEAIGCERCHGPGALHVEARLAEAEAGEAVDLTIVNPVHLPFERRLDVCRQCHLHTSVAVLREGRGAFDFRPSEALEDHLAFFVAHEPETGAAIDVVSHADRMQQSACFLETRRTEAPLECTTCHDPHEGFRDAGSEYFNATCRSCHGTDALAALPAHTAEADCAGCHMPKVRADDAPHASFTDHRIRVVGRGDEPAVDAEAPLMAPYFARDAGNREGQAYLGMALVAFGRQQADPRLMATGAATLNAALEADTSHGEAQFILGVAHLQLGDPGRALPPLERAVRLDPDHPQRLEALARAYDAAGRSPEVVERLYRRALAVQPALAGTRVHFGRFVQQQGRLGEAVEQFEAAWAEAPWLESAAFALGLAHAEAGNRAAAERALRAALDLDPSQAEALAAGLLVEVEGGRLAGAALLDLLAAHPLVARASGGPSFEPVPGGLRLADVPPGATVRLYTDDGLLLRTLAPGAAWDLTTDAGRPVGTGRYLLHVRPREAGRPVVVYRLALVVRRTS